MYRGVVLRCLHGFYTFVQILDIYSIYNTFPLNFKLSSQQELDQPISLLNAQYCMVCCWDLGGVCESLRLMVTHDTLHCLGLQRHLQKHNSSLDFHNLLLWNVKKAPPFLMIRVSIPIHIPMSMPFLCLSKMLNVLCIFFLLSLKSNGNTESGPVLIWTHTVVDWKTWLGLECCKTYAVQGSAALLKKYWGNNRICGVLVGLAALSSTKWNTAVCKACIKTWLFWMKHSDTWNNWS